MISQNAKYALRALVALTKIPAGESLMISEISRGQAIPKKFLEQILLELKRAGIVMSRRGRLGGYVLLRAPEQRRAMGEAGREYVEANHVTSVVAERLERVYVETLGRAVRGD